MLSSVSAQLPCTNSRPSWSPSWYHLVRGMSGSLFKYHAILDNGSRCQSCCNRVQIFGSRDPVSGWLNDCAECIIRWYRAQIANASRDVRHMMATKNLFGIGTNVTNTVLQFADLDIQFYRYGVEMHRRLRMMEALLTNVIDSDDEYFVDGYAALQRSPLTLLSDIDLTNRALQSEIQRDAPTRGLSLLDVVSSHLIKKRDLSAQRLMTYVQERDYVREICWGKFIWRGRYWLHNHTTGEWFYADEPHPWKCYIFNSRRWWMNDRGRRWVRADGTRWFWEPQH